MHAKRTGEAIDAFETAIRLNPGEFESLNNLGVAYLDIKEFKKAVLAFQRALAILPGHPAARYNLAIAQLASGHKIEALEQYGFLKITNNDLAQHLFNVIYRKSVVEAPK
jgi:Flp pilus assembly protein TadD